MIQGKTSLVALFLLGSLILNLFLGGIIAGSGLIKWGHPDKSSHKLPKLSWMIQSLPEESREKIRPILEEYRANIRQQMRHVKEMRRAVHQQLTAPDLNAETLLEALAKLRQERGEAQKMMHEALIKIASQLDAQDRQRLSETTRKPPHWRHKCDSEPQPNAKD